MNSESVDLIYLDPPFNSKTDYAAPIGSKAAGAEFKDTWTLQDVDIAWLDLIEAKYPSLNKVIHAATNKSDKSYLIYMAVRLLEMHRLLKDTGSIYLHCDPTMSHYLKLVMDAVFGRKNFVNEIIWHYQSGGRSRNHFPKKHDSLLFYAKDPRKKTFNAEDISVPRNRCASCGNEQSKWNNLKRHVNEDGRVYRTIKSAGKVYKYYDDDPVLPPNVWLEFSHLQQKDPERTGYPTQKPLKLLQRIIKASCPSGGIVLDPFCGCATACIASEKWDRQWIGIDISSKAADLVQERMRDELGIFFKGAHRTDTPSRTDLGNVIRYNHPDNKKKLYGEQGGNCNGCNGHFKPQNLTIDHIIPKSKGGTDHLVNLQLLCGHCNSVKGNRGQEYLLAKLAA